MTEFYPINSYEPLMPGLLIAGVAIIHVFLAQFAVGGGFLLCYFQYRVWKHGDEAARIFVSGYFKALVLISFILGAVTGVGIWFTSIQVSPATIGEMVLRFHWLWAVEWTFFCLEIVAGYCFYRHQQRLDDRSALILLAIYSGASWASLFWINGILSWQLTPGRWLTDGRLASGFFNPSFWPSLLFRTVVSLTLAALVACVVVNAITTLSRESRKRLIHLAARLMIPMVLMPILGVWFLAVMPADSRSWVLGGSAAMTLFLNASIVASLAVGGYCLIGLVIQRLYINGATATLLCALALIATAGGEFVREGSRKPFTIRGWLYANGVRRDRVDQLRRTGAITHDPYPAPSSNYPSRQVAQGARVYRRLCSVCHSVQGANGLSHLTGSWSLDQMRFNIANLQHTKPYMPPFAGNANELESLVQFLVWTNRGRPAQHDSSPDDATLSQIQRWLDEAGSEPGDFERHRH